MKKIFSIVMLMILIAALSACNNKSSSTVDELQSLSSVSLFSLAENLQEGEEGISRITHYRVDNRENSYIIEFENGDMLVVEEDDNFEYQMPFASTYTHSQISVYCEDKELDSSLAQIIVTINNTPSTGQVHEFDLTAEMVSTDFEFDSYINSAEIPEEITNTLFNDNILELFFRIKNIFEGVFNVSFK